MTASHVAAVAPTSQGTLGTAAFVLSVVAIVLTAIAFIERWHANRRQLLFALHTELTHVELASGRRELTNLDPTVEWWNDPALVDRVNRAIAMMDVLGYYARRRFVSGGQAVALWGEVAARVYDAALPYIARRRRREGRPRLWEHLEWFAKRAKKGSRWERFKRRLDDLDARVIGPGGGPVGAVGRAVRLVLGLPVESSALRLGTDLGREVS